MNFTRFDLDALFEEIKEIINFIELSQYKNRRYRIYTGMDNNNINFSIPNDSIAHLLGININYLSSTRRFNNTNSFDLLKEMCDNSYRIYQLYSEGIIEYDQLFSQYIFKKIEGFRKNIQLNCHETELICKYNKDRAYKNEAHAEKYDYIIVKKYDDKIGILGLVDNGNYYVPMSNQLYDSFEDANEKLKQYLNNQEITIMTGVYIFNIYDDYTKTVSLNYFEKEEKIENILKYKEEFNCSLDISKDYKYLLQIAKKGRNSYFEDNDLIEIIVNSVRNSKLIDTNLFNSSNLVKVADAINDFLCINNKTENNENQETYTQIKKALGIAKLELQNSKEKITNLENTNTELKKTVDNLTEENNEYKATEEKIKELLYKKPRM